MGSKWHWAVAVFVFAQRWYQQRKTSCLFLFSGNGRRLFSPREREAFLRGPQAPGSLQHVGDTVRCGHTAQILRAISWFCPRAEPVVWTLRFLQHRISLVGDTEVWAKLMKHMGLGAGGMADTIARFSPPWTTVTTGLSLPGPEREAWGEQTCALERLSPTRPGGNDNWHCRPLCCLCQTSPADPGH